MYSKENYSLINLKKEYINELKLYIVPEILNFFLESYKNVKYNCDYLIDFQNLLSNVPKWEKKYVKNIYNKLKEKSFLLDKLINKIFEIYNKLINYSNYNNINIIEFIHYCYSDSARNLWKQIYLFDHKINSLEIQKNHIIIEQKIDKSINNSIRQFSNIKKLLELNLTNYNSLNCKKFKIKKKLNINDKDLTQTYSHFSVIKNNFNDIKLTKKINLYKNSLDDSILSITLEQTDLETNNLENKVNESNDFKQTDFETNNLENKVNESNDFKQTDLETNNLENKPKLTNIINNRFKKYKSVKETINLDDYDNTSEKSIQLYMKDGTKEILNNLKNNDSLFFKDAIQYK